MNNLIDDPNDAIMCDKNGIGGDMIPEDIQQILGNLEFMRDTLNKKELKPCPFCGSVAVVESLGEDGSYVCCGNMDCECMDAISPEAWNNRPGEKQQAAITAEFIARNAKLYSELESLKGLRDTDLEHIQILQNKVNAFESGEYSERETKMLDRQNYLDNIVARMQEERDELNETIADMRGHFTVAANNLMAAEAMITQLTKALELCLPFVREDIIDTDTGYCAYCGEDLDDGHADDCKQMIAYHAARAAIAQAEGQKDGAK